MTHSTGSNTQFQLPSVAVPENQCPLPDGLGPRDEESAEAVRRHRDPSGTLSRSENLSKLKELKGKVSLLWGKVN